MTEVEVAKAVEIGEVWLSPDRNKWRVLDVRYGLASLQHCEDIHRRRYQVDLFRFTWKRLICKHGVYLPHECTDCLEDAASRLPARVENIAQDFPKGEGMSMFIGGPLLHGSAPVEPDKPKRVVYDAFGKAGKLVDADPITEQTYYQWRDYPEVRNLFAGYSPEITRLMDATARMAWNAAKGVKG